MNKKNVKILPEIILTKIVKKKNFFSIILNSITNNYHYKVKFT